MFLLFFFSSFFGVPYSGFPAHSLHLDPTSFAPNYGFLRGGHPASQGMAQRQSLKRVVDRWVPPMW